MSVPAPPRWMSPPPGYDSRTPARAADTTLTPYLQLPHILSLTWLAYPILSLLFIVFRLQLSSDSAQTAVNNAKGDLLASCQAAQRAASSTASMPRYMAIATNDQIVDAVNGTMNGAREALILALTVMEAIINFIVDIYRSTFLCFLELIVRGGLSLLISATQEISNFLQSTFSSIRTSIQNDIAGANKLINSTIAGINKVNPFGDINPPQITVPSLDSLQNVTLPSDFLDSLEKLNSSLPSVADLKNSINDLLDTPFELVKKDINDTFLGVNFNSSTLTVPDRSELSFCDNMDTSVVDDLGHDLLKMAEIGTIIMIVLALLLLAGHSALEWYKWRCLKQHLQYTREAWVSDPTLYHSGPASAPTVNLSDHNLLMLQAESAHPLLTRIANRMSQLLRFTPAQHIHLRWFLHYIFHPPALACFLIGFFGILSVQVQLFALGPLEAKYQAQAAGAVSDMSGQIFTAVNQSMYNQSALYANDVNGHINAIQTTINGGVFGWVNSTTTTLNDTINTFYTDVQNVVGTFFNGSFLEEPAQEFIRCFIGSKVDAIEEALTFLHDNLHVNLPSMNESALVLSPDQVNEATQPIAAAAVGGGGDGNQSLVGRLVNTYVESLKKERIMFAVFLGLWLLVVLMGLAVVFWHSYGRNWMEARRRRKFELEQRSGFNNIIVPFRAADEKGMNDAPQAYEPKPPGSFGPFDGTQDYAAHNAQEGGAGGLHPLTLMSNKFGKSFDSFFDRTPVVEDAPNESRFRALSRRFTTRRPATDDSEKQTHDANEEAEENSGWWKRVTLSLWKPSASSNAPGAGTTSRSFATPPLRGFRRAHRPQLTISTERASSVRDSNLPAIEYTSPSLENHDPQSQSRGPVSAWSVSPSPTPRTRALLAERAPPRPQVHCPAARTSNRAAHRERAGRRGRFVGRSVCLCVAHAAEGLVLSCAAAPWPAVPAWCVSVYKAAAAGDEPFRDAV
ncbi:hypothetical protein EVG20_g1324 [Dentipellis fragilis]|uniref:Plasma membrane fusion protein PRM1 n=1 Tax=Dentipellis fragilis TaxID=205917 RepID=A0A4Y9ZE57_9AGAM|nr:hypothetical protein EVG20_g1324 [Dentipellis fragilis]